MTLPEGPLTESVAAEHVRPLFSRVLDGKEGEVYMANHSLGRPPDATADNLAAAVSQWYGFLDDCWSDEFWIGEALRFRSLVAGLIGHARPDCVVPKTSAGQGLRAVLNAFPQGRNVNVVATTGEFDSIDFILKSYASLGRASVQWVAPTLNEGPVPLYTAASVCDAVSPGTDLVVVSSVFFTTGQVLLGLEDIVTKAHEAGALVLVDAYHAVGVLPFDMTALQADFVIGGCYKYLRGGPGACYLAISPKVVEEARLVTLDTGWFAKKDMFSYRRPDNPERATGGDAWLESTPPVLTAYQATPGIEFTVSVGVDRLRAYSLEQQERLREAFRSKGVSAFVPIDPSRYGAFTLVPHPEAAGLSARLKSRGLTVDSRGPFARFGPDVLNTNEDLLDAARATSEAWS